MVMVVHQLLTMRRLGLRARARTRPARAAQVQEELDDAAAAADSALKKLSEKLKSVDAAEAAKQSQALASLSEEVDAAHADLMRHISAFKAETEAKLAALKRVQEKMKKAAQGDASRLGVDVAKEECKKV
jgi:hypothetical protein